VAPGGRLLDVGCGVGGPMRTIAKATGARVTGLNNNAYQVGRGTQHNERAGLAEQCELVKGDFLAMPFDDNTFDGAYEIEATCHAPDKRSVYAEVLRVLKPGAVFAGYEWVTTDRYDPDNLEHRRLAHQVSAGNALPDLQGGDEVRRAMLEAGFEEVHCQDLAPTAHPDTPWYQSLVGEGMSVRGLARSTAGRAMTHAAVRTLEALRIAPRGSAGVSAMLNEGADALVAAGRLGIFTPSYLHVGRKPR
jgi:sterol 24-C-methyltransferase